MSGLVATRFENNTQLVENFEQIDAGLLRLPLALFQLHRSDFVERFHQRAERLEILVGLQHPVSRKVFINHADGAAHVAHFMRDRAHQDARTCQKLFQTRFLALAQPFGGIHYQGGQPRPHGGLVGGEKDVGQKDFAGLGLTAALHLGAKCLPRLSTEGTRPSAGR